MINKLKEIFNKPFPVYECAIKSNTDNNVFDSNKEHYVLFSYKNEADDYYEIRKLFPYIYKELDKTYYGWFDGQNVFSNKENQIHEYDELIAIGND